jgi:hypothetical protein
MSQNSVIIHNDINNDKEITIIRYKRYVTYKYCELCKKNISSLCFYKHVENKGHKKRLEAQQMEIENIDNTLIFNEK